MRMLISRFAVLVFLFTLTGIIWSADFYVSLKGIGRLHRGYWQKVKPGWHYACGEFGSEGLDFADVMRKYYPNNWLPKNTQHEKNWSPDSIPMAQTGKFHYMWFNTQQSLEDWVCASQEHQRWVTQIMTEAFRRDSRMNSFAIHLFIDAFPSGWMKTIMDFKRQPKLAYFTYRNALMPLMVNLRTDRYKFFCGEEINLEAWVCNDLTELAKNCYLHYQFEMDKKVIFSGHQKASIPVCESKFQGFLRFVAPKADQRSQATIRLGLVDKSRKVINDTAITVDLFPEPAQSENRTVFIIGSKQGKASKIAKELGLKSVFSGKADNHSRILIDDYESYAKRYQEVSNAVKGGAKAIFIELPSGKYSIAGSEVTVQPCGLTGMDACAQVGLYFVSPNTGHEIVKGFKPDDFKFWYNPEAGFVTPVLENAFSAEGFNEILTGGIDKGDGSWGKISAAAEKKHGKGVFRICQVPLAGRTTTNPTANIFARRLIGCKWNCNSLIGPEM